VIAQLAQPVVLRHQLANLVDGQLFLGHVNNMQSGFSHPLFQ
jgi:hypothetical protein